MAQKAKRAGRTAGGKHRRRQSLARNEFFHEQRGHCAVNAWKYGTNKTLKNNREIMQFLLDSFVHRE